ncbi:hypothetical protein C8Q80DRAFT_1166705 [Daedaleopsis nitida]|nr:hypothetical protein C8Q80DRAFT_1166705 [Daedaleopsis nitida]
MSGQASTPPRPVSNRDPVSAAAKNQDAVAEGWRKELLDRINVYSGATDKYIRTFVPSRARCTFTTDGDAFAGWEPVAGKETDSYSGLIKGLDKLVAPFPEDKRLSFIACDGWKMTFPFKAFVNAHHETSPDIVASLPGVVLDPKVKPTWRQIAIALEGKSTTAADPFEKNSLTSCKTLVQMAVNARNLMHAHGLLAVFVVGVYGDIIRIARFDHACAVASKPLSLRKLNDLKLVQRFFWRFVNPCDAVSFVGCDPTIRSLTSHDEQWLSSRLIRAGLDPTEVIVTEARWAEVYDDDCEDEDIAAMEPEPYIMFKALDVNGRLFSRATSVWLGVRDTRQEIDGELVDTEDDVGSVPIRIIKDAWRQLVREPESTFYDRLDMIEDDERVGLAKLLCGGDLGEREVRLWEAASYGGLEEEIVHVSRLLSPRTTSSVQVANRAPRSMVVPAKGVSPPSHRPMQQTFSWRLSRGNQYWYRERSHMRFVIDTVGRPLTRFKSTKELVKAVRDACRGHRLAMEQAGVLHRDVSVGNILIVDKPDPEAKFHGFLHDFDYSSMDADEPAEGTDSEIETNYGSDDDEEAEMDSSDIARDSSSTGESDGQGAPPNLKERTGTYYFMAVELLERKALVHEVWHDLESLFWVLLWVVLRHTAHKHPLKEKAASELFKYGDDDAALGAKLRWLRKGDSEKLVIVNNKPLTRLLERFRKLVHASAVAGTQRLTYAAVEEIFEEALDSNGWPEPENDAARKYVLPEMRTCTVMVAKPKKRKAAARPAEEKQGTGSKRKAAAPRQPRAPAGSKRRKRS